MSKCGCVSGCSSECVHVRVRVSALVCNRVSIHSVGVVERVQIEGGKTQVN